MANDLVYVILDSCRFDTFRAAATPHFDRIGELELRHSYASWTSPSHYTYLMGMIPHCSPQGVFASEVYKNEFSKWVDRLGASRTGAFAARCRDRVRVRAEERDLRGWLQADRRPSRGPAPRFELYETGVDPTEQRNLAAEDPARVAVLYDRLRAWQAAHAPRVAAVLRAHVTGAEREQLRALGYLE